MFPNHQNCGPGVCWEHILGHGDAFGGSYGCWWSIFIDLGLIWGSILGAISDVLFCETMLNLFWDVF